MSKQRYLSDNEIGELAKDVIRVVSKSIKLPQHVSVVEVEDIVGLFFKYPDSSASAFYSPQQRIVEILREYEDFYSEILKDETPPGRMNTTLRSYLISACGDEEIKTLITKALKHFPELFKRLSKVEQKVLEEANTKRVSVERHFTKQQAMIEERKVLYRKTTDLRPLWNHITEYFDKYDTTSDIKSDLKFIKLAGGEDVPNNLLNKVYKRKEGNDPSTEPLHLAIEHACHLLGIQRGEHDSHVNWYYEGQKWVEDDEWFANWLNPPAS